MVLIIEIFMLSLRPCRSIQDRSLLGWETGKTFCLMQMKKMCTCSSLASLVASVHNSVSCNVAQLIAVGVLLVVNVVMKLWSFAEAEMATAVAYSYWKMWSCGSSAAVLITFLFHDVCKVKKVVHLIYPCPYWTNLIAAALRCGVHYRGISQFYLHIHASISAFAFPAKARPHSPTSEGWKA